MQAYKNNEISQELFDLALATKDKLLNGELMNISSLYDRCISLFHEIEGKYSILDI
ncbi:MAG: hypothetical protein GX288_01115 [Clostridiales bacterium]|nr:hypothetical protein [Clostridiales bacterium]